MDSLYRKNRNHKNSLKRFNLEKRPVRFLISKDLTPNAWIVGHSVPPIVVLTEGLFKERESQICCIKKL